MREFVFYRAEIRRMVNQVMSGNELLVEDPRVVRCIARVIGRENRGEVVIGRDSRNGITIIKLRGGKHG